MSYSCASQEPLFSPSFTMYEVGTGVYFNTLSAKMSCAVTHCYIAVLCLPSSAYIYVSVDMSAHIHAVKRP